MVAEKINTLIEQKGLKKLYVASKVGISGQKLSDILAGRALVRVEMIPKFCEVLQVEPNDLFKEGRDENRN
jgi:DNA-binding Xre family transcriptional regulator